VRACALDALNLALNRRQCAQQRVLSARVCVHLMLHVCRVFSLVTLCRDIISSARLFCRHLSPARPFCGA
jgi:hypothetical protein